MKYGDIAGKGKFYDDAGAPVLAKGERLRGRDELRFGLYSSLLASKPFILDLYEGTVYLTDRRLIGVRRPDPRKAALARLSYTADMDVLSTADRMKQVLEQGGCEFFSAGLDEIVRIRRSRLARAVDIIVSDQRTGKKYHLAISPEKRFGKLFGEGGYEGWLEGRGYAVANGR